MKRKYLSLAIGVVLVAPAMPAWSQEEAGGSPAEVKATQLDTVTVTARKREETLQDVPVAVTAFTPEALDTLNINAIALLILDGMYLKSEIYFEAALVIAMLGFVGTVVLSKYVLRRDIVE